MQKLIYPQEVEVWFILPALRKKLCLKLIKKGLSQKDVAQIMNSTDASVSQYVKHKRASEKLFSRELDKEIEKSAQRIIKDEENLNDEIMRLNEIVKEEGLICKVHRSKSLVKKKDLPCESCSYNGSKINGKK